MTDEERTKLRADARAKMMANPGNGIPSLTPPGTPARAAAAKAKPGKPAGDSGRWATLNAFVDASMVDMTRVEALAWIILFRDARNGTVCTGMSDIARRAGCSKRAVVDAVGSLVAKGLLSVVRKGRKNSGPSRYTVYAEPRHKGQ
jgi:hypothetical protein